MTRHLASTRAFPQRYTQPVTVSAGFWPARPVKGGALVVWPLLVGPLAGEPFTGLDPTAPATWVRPYNPQPGMVQRLNFDGAKYAADVPMGQTWRNRMQDRADVPKTRAQWLGRIRRRRLWRTANGCYTTGSRTRQATTRRSWVTLTPRSRHLTSGLWHRSRSCRPAMSMSRW